LLRCFNVDIHQGLTARWSNTWTPTGCLTAVARGIQQLPPALGMQDCRWNNVPVQAISGAGAIAGISDFAQGYHVRQTLATL